MTTSPSAPVLTTRHATLADLAALLRDQQSRKLDVVAPATAVRSAGARLVIDETDPQLTADGVTMTAGHLHPHRGLRRRPRGKARHPRRLPAAAAHRPPRPVRRQRQRLAGAHQQVLPGALPPR